MNLDQCPIFFQSNSFKVKLKDKLIGKSQCISPQNKKPFSIFWGPQLYLYPETPGIPPSDQAEFLVHVESNSYLEKDVLARETLERRWREGVGSDGETKKFGMRGPQQESFEKQNQNPWGGAFISSPTCFLCLSQVKVFQQRRLLIICWVKKGK